MKQLVTQGIVLSRTDYGEADRITTFLTPDHGKLRLMARGVRRVKSKLAGGIELFSISDITYIMGKSDMGTLISARLRKHYGNIVTEITRVQLGYDFLKRLNRVTEDQPEPAYFDLLQAALDGLNTATIETDLLQLWFEAQLLKLYGHAPNLSTDLSGTKLEAAAKYGFDFDSMCFAAAPQGRWQAEHIKILRLLFGTSSPARLSLVQGINPKLIADLQPLLRTLSAGV